MSSLLNSPVVTQSLVASLASRLEAAILAGEIPLGSMLREKNLAESLGVSRGPLREAIRSLEGRKLVQRIPNIGARVISLSPADLYDIFVMREALEGIACRMATEKMSDEEIVSLRDLLDRHAEAHDLRSGSGYYQYEEDLDFHHRIVRASGNTMMFEYLNKELYYLLRIYRHRSSVLAGRSAQSLQEHRDVVSAMLERDPALAESLMRRHVRNARDNLLKAPAPR